MEAIRLAEIALPNPCAARDYRAARLDARIVLRPLALALAVALIFSGVCLIVRRLMGAFTDPLNDAALLSVAAVALVWAAAARLLWRLAGGGPDHSWSQRGIDWLPTIGLVLIGTSIAVSGSSVAAVVLLCALIAAEEYAAGLLWRLPAAERLVVPFETKTRRHTPSDQRRTIGAPRKASANRGEILQQCTRERTRGGDWIHGTIRVAFTARQRVAIEHLVFCPMIGKTPTINAQSLDELDCSVRTTHAYRYGARLEIKLREPCDEPCEVLVGYEVRG